MITCKRTLIDAAGIKYLACIEVPFKSNKDEWCSCFSLKCNKKSIFKRKAYGVDSLQALMNAIEALRISVEQYNANLRWVFSIEQYHAINYLIPNHDYKFALKVKKLVDKEVKCFLERARKVKTKTK
jgi:hypothetical protein